MKKLIPKFKLWLNTKNDKAVLGDGKWRLLKQIEAQGSLKNACDSLGISYRKAWGDLKKSQDALGIALVKTLRGGRQGGQSVLTPNGKKWLEAYGKFRQDIGKAVLRAHEKHLKKLVK